MFVIRLFGPAVITLPIRSTAADLKQRPLGQQNIIRTSTGTGLTDMAIWLAVEIDKIVGAAYWGRLRRFGSDGLANMPMPATILAALLLTPVLWPLAYIGRAEDGDRDRLARPERLIALTGVARRRVRPARRVS